MNETFKLLVVDDDEIDRMAVRRALRSAGMQAEITETTSCDAAIAALIQQNFDCALIDYRLPDGDGLSLVQKIRSAGFRVALIMLTGQGDEQTAVELMKAGAGDYLLKSKLSADVLSRSLRNVIRLHRAEIEAAVANQKLRESEARFRSLVQHSSDIVTILNMDGTASYTSPSVERILGYASEQLTGRSFFEFIHPDDLPTIQQAFAHTTDQPGLATPIELRFRHATGEWVYLEAIANNLLHDSNIRGVIINSRDITERKRVEAEVVNLNRDLEQRVSELQTLLDVIPIGIGIANDRYCSDVRVNAHFSKLLEIAPEANASFNPTNPEKPKFRVYQTGRELSPHEMPMQRAALESLEIADWELEVLLQDGKRLTLLQYAAPLFDEQKAVRGCVGAFLDITERKRAEEAQRFLAQASNLLSASLDYQTTLENLANLIVPYLADWCSVDMLQDDHSIYQLAVASTAMLKARVQWSQEPRYSLDPHAVQGIANVLRTGRAELHLQIPDSLLAIATRNPDQLPQMQQVGFKSAMIVPLIARGRTLGAITFLTAESQREYTAADLALAEDLAHRAALAVDNARLYSTTQEAEKNLRQAILVLGEHQQQLRTLQRLTDLLNQRLTNLPNLLQVMIHAICETIPGAEFGLIVLQNVHSQQLELTATAGSGLEQLHLNAHFSSGEGLLGQVFLTGESQLIKADSHQAQMLEHPHLPASLCAVAIESAQAGRLGVLAIANWHDTTALDEEDLHLLAAFGEQAAIALNNAQLIQALEEREERLAVQNEILAQQNQKLERQRHQIQQKNLQLVQAAQLKSQFLATMSHELRTPMNAIIGFSQLLLRQGQQPLNKQQVDMVERILSNGKNLLNLINDILDLSKIEAGHLKLHLECFNLAQLVTETAHELRSLADQKNLELQVDVALDNPQVFNDSVRVRQILANLLSNAIKFTESGSVQVSVRELADQQLILTVQDTGIGIAQTDLPHIFEEFRQLDQSLTKRYPGTGLGLAITDWLVQVMHGNIRVESELGKGSTFCVSLPRQVEPMPEALPTEV